MTKKIMIELIEDDVLLARQFVAALERENYAVHYSRYGDEAMAAIDQNLPDVIILDILLPSTTGFTLLHELQSYDDTRSIPVILCTSVAVEIKEVAAYGVRRIIDKTTMHSGDLIAAIKAVTI